MNKDYRDLKGKYDKLVSIEMIEAVGERHLDKYFPTIKNNLKPNGVGAIQAIIIKDELFNRYRKNQDFIQKYIFPGGFLPSLQSIKDYSKKYLKGMNFPMIYQYIYIDLLLLIKALRLKTVIVFMP